MGEPADQLDTEIPEEFLRVLRRAVTLLRSVDRAASIRLRLSRDRVGVERLMAESFEGEHIDLLADSLTRSVD